MSPGPVEAGDGSKTVAVVVTHHPEFAVLEALLRALAPQVAATVVVDNGSAVTLCEWLDGRGIPGVSALYLGDNLGVAAAQNRGVDWARRRGAEYVVLFDQDSLPAPDMVARLAAVARAKAAEGTRVAAVGPRYRDQRGKAAQPFVRVRGLRIGRVPCRSDADVVEVDHLIASGSLIPMAALDAVGGMVEELFIDYVDTEWVLRARRRGLRAYGVCGAAMRHELGDAPIRLLGREVVTRGPLRHYYLFRNAVWMYRQPWVPLAWKLADGLRLTQKFVFYALFARPWPAQLRMMLRGLWHGLRGRMGRHDPAG